MSIHRSFAVTAALAWYAFALCPAQAQPQPLAGRQPLSENEFQAGKPVAAVNEIVQPVPLTTETQESALTSIDQHLASEITALGEQINKILPDELAILSKTGGWKAEQQRALTTALRAVDPTAVFQAWSQANPDDTASGEIVARQTAVRRSIAMLEQDVQNHVPVTAHLKEMEDSLEKISASTPGTNDLVESLAGLKTWSDARDFIATGVPGKGLTAELPPGRVPLIFNPGMRAGEAIVLGNGAVMIGNDQGGKLEITTGNAAEALGMPIVTTNPLPDFQGQENQSGVVLMNPSSSGATVEYNVNGDKYRMEPGMFQRLPEGRRWVVAYDRGDGQGPAAYTPAPGTYHFTPTDTGWQLYQVRYHVVLDNTPNPREFNFLVFGKRESVAPNGTKTIDSLYPFVIKYDRGNGSELASKIVKEDGAIQIGVNVADNHWDLFPTHKNRREVANRKLFP